MRDLGLIEAINAVGGVTELARRIGLSQPSVTNWNRVPADRVAAVELASGVARVRLRPDLYGNDLATNKIDEIDAARAQEYALLAVLLAQAPDANLLKRISRIEGDDTPLGQAHRALALATADTNANAVDREYFDLFIGVGRGELLPYASYYLTGFLQERPLARLREDLAQLGVERVESNSEPEDHAATLCEIMAAIIGGKFAVPEGADRNLFQRHMSPWLRRFFTDLERAQAARFYRSVGALGRIFMDVEMEAYALPA